MTHPWTHRKDSDLTDAERAALDLATDDDAVRAEREETDRLVQALRGAPGVVVPFEAIQLEARPRRNGARVALGVVLLAAMSTIFLLPSWVSEERDRGFGDGAPVLGVDLAVERDGAVAPYDGRRSLQEDERVLFRLKTFEAGTLQITDARTGAAVHPTRGSWEVGPGTHSPSADGAVLGYVPDVGNEALLRVRFCQSQAPKQCVERELPLVWAR